MQFAGKVALVTGAGSGIGRAAARLLSADGATVVALGRNEGSVAETVAEIEQSGGKAESAVADISVAKQMEAALAGIDERHGRLDIVLANAGFNGVWAPLEELTPADWQETIGTNLTGTFHTVKYAVPLLKRQGGAVVVTSSVNGTRIFSNTGATAYSCAKAGQVAFAKMTALELARYGIRVNAICPGAIATAINADDRAARSRGVPHSGRVPRGLATAAGRIRHRRAGR